MYKKNWVEHELWRGLNGEYLHASEHFMVDTTFEVSTPIFPDLTPFNYLTFKPETFTLFMGDDHGGDSSSTSSVDVNGPSQSGEFETANDEDWFRFQTTSVDEITISILTMPAGAQLSLVIRDSMGFALTSRSISNTSETWSFTPDGTDTYFISFVENGVLGNYSFEMTTSSVEVDDFAANTSTDGVLAVGSSVSGVFEDHHAATDKDWFRVIISEAQTVEFTLSIPTSQLALYDASGSLITSNTGGSNSRLTHAFSEAGTFFIAANSQQSGAVSDVHYTISAANPTVTGDDFTADTSTDGVLSVGGSVSGIFEDFHADNDVDWFRIVISEAQSVEFSLSLSGSDLALYDASGSLITDNSGSSNPASTSLLTHAFTQTGTYYIAAISREAGVMSDVSYTLSADISTTADDYTADTNTNGIIAPDGTATGVLEQTDDVDWFRIDLTSRQQVVFDVTMTGSSRLTLYNASGDIVDGPSLTSSTTPQPLDFAVAETGTYFIAIENFSATTDVNYTLSATLLPDDFGEAPASAGTANTNGFTTGTINRQVDSDWFQLDVEAGQTYFLIIPITDTDFRLRDLNGDILADSINSGGYQQSAGEFYSIFPLVADSNATYFIDMYTSVNSNSFPFDYQFEVFHQDTGLDDYSSDFNLSTTASLVMNGSLSGRFENKIDEDVFQVEFRNGFSYEIEVDAGVTIEIFDTESTTGNGAFEMDNSYDASRDKQVLTITPHNPGTYYIRLNRTDLDNPALDSFDYTIKTTETQLFPDGTDDSDSTLSTPDPYVFGTLLEVEANFGRLTDYDYYTFTADPGSILRLAQLNTEDGSLGFRILDENQNEVLTSFEEFAGMRLDVSDLLHTNFFRLEEGGTYTIVFDSRSNTDGETATHLFNGTLIPNYQPPPVFAEQFPDDMVYWGPMPDPGEAPDVIGDAVELGTFTYPNGAPYDVNSLVIAADEAVGYVTSNSFNTELINHGAIWSGGVSGSAWGTIINHGLIVAATRESDASGTHLFATAISSDGFLQFENHGDVYAITPGFQAIGINNHVPEGQQINTGNIYAHSATGRAIGLLFGNYGEIDNSGYIEATSWFNAAGISFFESGEVNNSGTINVFSSFATSIGIRNGNLLNNSGDIIADISYISSELSDIVNSGNMIGDILIFDGRHPTTGEPVGYVNSIINTGIIDGDILVSGGDDLVDNAGGFISGFVDLGDGDDTGIGGKLSDWFFGGTGNDILTGNLGNDVLEGGLGDDIINGGEGFDAASYASADSAVNVDLNLTQAQDTQGAGVDTLTNIEVLEGSNFNDILYGNSAGNYVLGGSGNDYIDGGDAGDYLDGGLGAADWVSYQSATSGITVSLAITDRQETGSAGFDLLLNFENLEGSDFGDTLSGNSGANYINAQDGNDWIFGDKGNDTLFGGTGIDHFIFNLGDGVDRIRDFEIGTDIIALRDMDPYMSLQDFRALMTQSEGHVMLDMGNGDSIRIDGVTIAELTSDHFVFGNDHADGNGPFRDGHYYYDDGVDKSASAQEKPDTVPVSVSLSPDSDVLGTNTFEFKDTPDTTIIADVLSDEELWDVEGWNVADLRDTFLANLPSSDISTYVDTNGYLTIFTEDDHIFYDPGF